MGLDLEKEAEVRGWLIKADDDLRAADAAMKATPPVLGVAVYLAQQAAEKAMKGFLTWHDRKFRKTHNLVEIGGQCAAIDSSLEPLLRKAPDLTKYVWRFRYPGEPNDPSMEDAERAIAVEVREAVLSRLQVR
jgi:HEPN domain-containing protein